MLKPCITGVAARHNGQVFSLSKPARHPDVLRKIREETGVARWTGDLHYDQGFVDAEGTYLHRKAALARAFATGQLPPDFKPCAGILFSEDLW